MYAGVTGLAFALYFDFSFPTCFLVPSSNKVCFIPLCRKWRVAASMLEFFDSFPFHSDSLAQCISGYLPFDFLDAFRSIFYIRDFCSQCLDFVLCFSDAFLACPFPRFPSPNLPSFWKKAAFTPGENDFSDFSCSFIRENRSSRFDPLLQCTFRFR